MAAQRSMHQLVRISRFLARSQMELAARRECANVATSPTLQQESEEERVGRELAKRCVPAMGSTTLTTDDGGHHHHDGHHHLHHCGGGVCMMAGGAHLAASSHHRYGASCTLMRAQGAHRCYHSSDDASIIDVPIQRRERGRKLRLPSNGNATRTMPGQGFTTLPFPLPLLPNVAKQIEVVRAQEIESQLRKKEELEKMLEAARKEDEMYGTLEDDSRRRARRSIEYQYRQTTQRQLESKGHM